MSVITENMPRTMGHHAIKRNDEKRLEIAGQIDEFFAKGNKIEQIAQGVSKFIMMNGRDYLASMQACTTASNKASKSEILPIRR